MKPAERLSGLTQRERDVAAWVRHFKRHGLPEEPPTEGGTRRDAYNVLQFAEQANAITQSETLVGCRKRRA